MKKTTRLILGLLIVLLILNISSVFAQTPAENTEEKICVVYITGVGCPNCAITDPAVLTELTNKYTNLIVIEYEIYHQREDNIETANGYFNNYLPNIRAGVPLIIFNKNQVGLGRFDVLDSENIIKNSNSNKCPLPNGSSTDFKDLDMTSLPGKPKIWTNNRILIKQEGGDNNELKQLLTQEPSPSLKKDFKKIEPLPIEISEVDILFEHAVKINGGVLQWEIVHEQKSKFWSWPIIILILIIILLLVYIFLIKRKIHETPESTLEFSNQKKKKYLIIGISIIALIGFFILTKNISSDFLKQIGYTLPLPLFTFLIALVDGFNPCNIFVLTFLLGLLVSVSHSRKRIYIIGYTFIFVVFIIYFLFMAAWLNIFKFIGFITPLRITIACIALIAGIINCKELLFFRKGITLMIQEKHKGLLLRKIENMKEVILKGSVPALIVSSIILAAFASLVELPCTAGFPIIYTAVLVGRFLESTMGYYLYLIFYNLIYVIPLIVMITIFGYYFKGKQITKEQMQIIKFIGGLIMILLGITLLVNPSLMGIGT